MQNKNYEEQLEAVEQKKQSQLAQVEQNKQNAIAKTEQTYQSMIDEAGKVYQQQIDNAEKQKEILQQQQQAQTDFTIGQIEQQKEQAQEDYIDEQSDAYTDYKKQTAKHGVAAEQMAQAGLAGTGYSESSQVAMYTAYQNRVATARKSIQDAMATYDSTIAQAKLQNDAALAQIAMETLQQQMMLALEGFQYQNQLTMELTQQKMAVEQQHHGYYLEVLDQINAEKDAIAQQQRLAEEKRQYDLSLEEEKRQFDLEYELAQKESGAINGIPSIIVAMLKEFYPNGVITSENMWKEMVNTYGENALKAAGYSAGGNFGGNAEDYRLTNQQGDGWVKVGNGRMTWTELANAIERGDVEEVVDEQKGTITFRYVSKTKPQTPPPTTGKSTGIPSNKKGNQMVSFGG